MPMNIQFTAVNYELTVDETSLFEEKLSTLEKFSGKGQKEVYLHVTLGKATEAHQHGGIWFAEGNINVNGKKYFAKATTESLRGAVDEVLAELSRELSKAKDKRGSFVKRGGAKIKNLLRFGR